MILLLLAGNLIAQYTFKDEIRLPDLPVESQGRTGTCWSFATTSFLESELIRMGKSGQSAMSAEDTIATRRPKKRKTNMKFYEESDEEVAAKMRELLGPDAR